MSVTTWVACVVYLNVQIVTAHPDMFICMCIMLQVCVRLTLRKAVPEGGGKWVWRAQCAASVERKVVWYGGRLGPNRLQRVSLACLSLICLLGNGKVITNLHREIYYPPLAPEHNAYNTTSHTHKHTHTLSLYRRSGCLRLICKWCCRALMLYFAIQTSVQRLAYNFCPLKFSVSLRLIFYIYIKLTYINAAMYVLHF